MTNPEQRRQEVCAWLSENGVEPTSIAADGLILAAQDHKFTLTARQFLIRDGVRYLCPDACCGDEHFATEKIVREVSEPPFWDGGASMSVSYYIDHGPWDSVAEGA